MAGRPTGGSADGFMGSTQFGYNSQTGPFVAWRSRRMSVARALISLAQVGFDLSNFPATSRAGLARCRPRAGVAADKWLVYGTGGLAYSSGDEARAGLLARHLGRAGPWAVVLKYASWQAVVARP